MKKSKIITGLSAAFVSAMALMSCSQLITPKKGVVLSIDGVDYTAEDLWKSQDTPAAAQAMFDGVYKVAVRNYFTNQDGKEYKDDIKRELEIKISAEKSKASSEASKNGTSYDVEWQKILDSNNCDNESELRDKFEYDLQKDKFDENFYSKKFTKSGNSMTNYDVLRDGGKLNDYSGNEYGTTLDGYINKKHPYHIKHILVKLESIGESNNTTATISEQEAINLNKVITALAKGNSFKTVSDLYSQDDTAKKEGGSLGIMSLDTSFVDDFKLGIYLYESFIGSSTSSTGGDYASENARVKLFGDYTEGSPADSYKEGTAGWYATKLKGLVDPTASAISGIGQIPFEAALALGENDYTVDGGANYKKGLAKFGYDDTKLKEAGVDSLDDKYLPRNVIFNKYFNKHNIMVITPTTLPTYTTFTNYIDSTGTKRVAIDAPIGSDISNLGDYATGFTNTNIKNNDKILDGTKITKPLHDENGRIILAFRSGTSGDGGYQGIHFVVIERSPFIGKEADDNGAIASSKQVTTLKEYYTHYYPGQTDGAHPDYPDDAGAKAGKPKKTFVHHIDTDTVTYKNRSDTVKSELRKCVNNIDTYIYEYLLDKANFTFTDGTGKYIESEINKWIDVTREDFDYQTQTKWDDDWERYYNSLKSKLDERTEVDIDPTASNEYWSELIPESCVYALTSGALTNDQLKAMFNVGGVFHD